MYRHGSAYGAHAARRPQPEFTTQKPTGIGVVMSVSINQIGSDNNGYINQSEFNTWSTTGLSVSGVGAWAGMKNVSVLIHFVDNSNVVHNVTEVFTGAAGAW